jgi:hypothetical protein
VVSPEGTELASNDAVYVAKRATALTNPITNDSIFLSADSAAFSAFVPIQDDIVLGTPRLNSRVWYARASGRVTTGTTSTLIATIYYSPTARTSLTYNGTGVSSTGATFTSGNFSTTSGNWFIEAMFTWDITSKVLGGYFAAFSSATPSISAETVCTNQTSVDLTNIANPGPGLIVGAHFGTGNAANVVTLDEFLLEVR